MPTRNETTPTIHLTVRQDRTGEAFFEAKWRHRAPDGTTRQMKRRVGLAWVQQDTAGTWVKRRGRPTGDHLDHRAATVAADTLVREVEAALSGQEASDRVARDAPVTFRQVTKEYLRWLETVRGAKPSTLSAHRSVLAEPGAPHARGSGTSAGLIMRALGDRAAADVTTRDINAMLVTIAETGVTPRTVNKARATVAAIYSFGCDEATFALTSNPAAKAQRRRERVPEPLDWFSVEEVEAIARTLESGGHRDPGGPAVSDDEQTWRTLEDRQDADAVRIAAYTGLRRGELVALRWSDVDFTGRKIIVRRAVSGDVEESSTKSGRAREVPLTTRAAAALDRLSLRRDFTSRDDYVLCSRAGGRLDGSALRRRYVRARDAAGLRPLRWHDLRHAFGSTLVANGIDLASVQAAMGHASITTTQRYLHARPAIELADRFSAAFEGERPDNAPERSGRSSHLSGNPDGRPSR